MDKFINYFDYRYRDRVMKSNQGSCGPIITISRQTGCDAILTAKQLVKLLNQHYKTDKWHWVDKQILIEAARQLKTDSQRVEAVLKGTKFSGISDMINAISGDYISDMTIKKVITDVVMSICADGYAVLVGRGGVSIARGIENALHVRLVAPFYWRVENIIKKRQYGIEDAEEFVVDTDEKRYNIILNFLDKKPLNIDYLFDATINRSAFNTGQVAELILELYKRRMEKVKSDGPQAGGLHMKYG